MLLPLTIAPAARVTHGPTIPPGLVDSAQTTRRVVALTFDDGPSRYTPRVLAVLHRYSVPATFFEVGSFVSVYPQYVHRITRAGDEIGNHTYSHLDLQDLATPSVVAQISRNQHVIRRVSGTVPLWFRPPYGDVDERIIGIASSLGLHTITWSVDPSDWSLPGTDEIIRRVLAQTHPGSVILLHDGGGDRSETIAALPQIIVALKKRGYRFGTVDELFGLGELPDCVPRAVEEFSKRGITPNRNSPIFKTWRRLVCFARNIGPATSRVNREDSGGREQDFRTTGHEMVWQRGHGVKVILMWNWGAKIFGAEGIDPRYGRAITRAWFQQYFEGANWGAALSQPAWHQHVLRQRFVRGTAEMAAGQSVVWRKADRAGSRE